MKTMKQSEFIKALKLAHDTPNGYNNSPGKNLGYHWQNGKFTYDCWNLIKVVLAGWNATNPVGTNIKPTVTGDIDGKAMLLKCSDRSKDFGKLRQPGTYLYIYSSPHSGIYLGEFSYNGKTYNVVECTTAWGGGVLYTYIDSNDYRYKYKGGPRNTYKWEEFGLLPWVEYTVDKAYEANDIVYFKGNKEYSSSTSDKAIKTVPSLARITKVIDSKHPYHCRRINPKGEFIDGGVYGWVDSCDLTS